MYIEWDICLITTATENSTDTNTEYWWPPPHSLAAQDESSLASINLSGIWPRLMATPALASSAPSLLAHFCGLMFTHVYMLTYTATQIHTLQSPLAATPDRWALMTHAFVQSPSANPCIPEWPHTPSALSLRGDLESLSFRAWHGAEAPLWQPGEGLGRGFFLMAGYWGSPACPCASLLLRAQADEPVVALPNKFLCVWGSLGDFSESLLQMIGMEVWLDGSRWRKQNTIAA